MQHLKIELSPDNWRFVKDLESNAVKYSIYAYDSPQHNEADLASIRAMFPRHRFKLVTL